MLGFTGNSDNKIDTKGRVSIPVDFKRLLEARDPDWEPDKNPRIAIVYGKNKTYLECYSLEAFEALQDKLSKLPRGEPRQHLMRRYVTEAHIAQIDPTGRMVLPQQMREKVGFQQEAFFEGNIDTFKILCGQLRDQETEKTDAWDQNLGDKDPLSYLNEISDEA